MKEIWKDVPGYEGYYQVSNLGRVKSLDRIVSRGDSLMKLKGRLLKQGVSGDRYYTVSLLKNGNQKTYTVHSLLAMCFLGYEIGSKLIVDHKDNNCKNNNISNLQIITQRENSCKDKCLKSKYSKYIGVTFDKKSSKWISRIRIGNKRIHLGSFKDEYDAHLAYQTKLKEIQND